MKTVTTQFLDAVRTSHRFAVQVDILQDGIVTQSGIEVVGGTVTLNRTAEIRGTCSIDLAATSPTSAFDPLTPFGAELQIYSGVQFSTGPEFVSLGIFGIQSLSDDGGRIHIDGLDRAQKVKDAEFENTYVIPAGSNYADAILGLVNDGVPGLTYEFVSTTAETPLLVFSDDSSGRWAEAQKMAAAIGCDLYFDSDGTSILAPVPDPQTTPVVELHDGEGGVVVTASKAWSRTPSFNKVIAYSSDPGTSPVRAEAVDDDPTSPTFYGGPFGRKTKKQSGPYTTQIQAQVAADAMLRQVLGIAQTLELTVAPNPALEPGDVASVRRVSIGIDEIDVLDSCTHDLTLGTMSLGVRARQVTQ